MMSLCGEKKNTAPPMTLAPEPEHSVLTTDQSLKPKPAKAQKSGAFLAVRTSRRAQPDLKVTCLTKDTGARSAYPANRVNSHSLLTNLGEQHSSVWRVLTSLPTRGRPARTDAPVLPATEAKSQVSRSPGFLLSRSTLQSVSRRIRRDCAGRAPHVRQAVSRSPLRQDESPRSRHETSRR